MKLADLKSNIGSRRRKKDVGRGRASGHGKTSCRGHNGQGQRSGKGRKTGFEGGQTPIYRRLPKFQTNERPNKLCWNVVNLCDLESLAGNKQITLELLLEKGIIEDQNDGLRILGSGELKFSATFIANHFSESAKKKIEAAGGKWEIPKVTES